MNEAKFQTMFNKWAKYNMTHTFVAELKFTTKGYLPFSAVKDHQADHLDSCEIAGFPYKVPDLGARNPFDMFYIYKEPAYIVVMFYKKGQKEFVMIPFGKFQHESSMAELPGQRKSLTEKRAKEIGETHLLYDDLNHY